MARSPGLTTTVSTKGQVVLPKAIRQHLNWKAGARLVVEEKEDGILLRTAPVFAESTPDEVFGLLKVGGRPRTIAQMDAAVLAEARRRHGRD